MFYRRADVSEVQIQIQGPYDLSGILGKKPVFLLALLESFLGLFSLSNIPGDIHHRDRFAILIPDQVDGALDKMPLPPDVLYPELDGLRIRPLGLVLQCLVQ